MWYCFVKCLLLIFSISKHWFQNVYYILWCRLPNKLWLWLLTLLEWIVSGQNICNDCLIILCTYVTIVRIYSLMILNAIMCLTLCLFVILNTNWGLNLSWFPIVRVYPSWQFTTYLAFLSSGTFHWLPMVGGERPITSIGWMVGGKWRAFLTSSPLCPSVETSNSLTVFFRWDGNVQWLSFEIKMFSNPAYISVPCHCV